MAVAIDHQVLGSCFEIVAAVAVESIGDCLFVAVSEAVVPLVLVALPSNK